MANEPEFRPNLDDAAHEAFYQNLVISGSHFTTPEQQSRFRNTRILFAGAGSIGNPGAVLAVRQGSEHVTVADPDDVEESNLARQIYQYDQVGTNKAEGTIAQLHGINPFSQQFIGVPEGITEDNVSTLVDGHDVVIDAIDMRALDMIYRLHEAAAKSKKPVIMGIDLAGTAMIQVYRYDIEDIPPLKGALDSEKVAEFLKVKAMRDNSQITDAQFLDYIYLATADLINISKVPVEQFEEVINRSPTDTRTYQDGATSVALSALMVETIRKIINGERVRNEISVDLPSEVRKNNPTVFKRALLMITALKIVKEREKRVRQMLNDFT